MSNLKTNTQTNPYIVLIILNCLKLYVARPPTTVTEDCGRPQYASSFSGESNYRMDASKAHVSWWKWKACVSWSSEEISRVLCKREVTSFPCLPCCVSALQGHVSTPKITCGWPLSIALLHLGVRWKHTHTYTHGQCSRGTSVCFTWKQTDDFSF